MTEINIPQDAQSVKKWWHGVLLGLGCGIAALIPIFACLFTAVVVGISLNSASITTTLDQMSPDEILQSLTTALVLLASVSLVAALIAGVFSGRQAYRYSADAHADKRLWSSIAAGLGLGLLFLFIGGCIGVLLEVFVAGASLLSESTYMLYVVFPLVPGLAASFVGSVLGVFFVFRRMLPKTDAQTST